VAPRAAAGLLEPRLLARPPQLNHPASCVFRTVALHRRLPQCEHRNHFTTSTKSASHPTSVASVHTVFSILQYCVSRVDTQALDWAKTLNAGGRSTNFPLMGLGGSTESARANRSLGEGSCTRVSRQTYYRVKQFDPQPRHVRRIRSVVISWDLVKYSYPLR
jgi:hypothetical protein